MAGLGIKSGLFVEKFGIAAFAVEAASRRAV